MAEEAEKQDNQEQEQAQAGTVEPRRRWQRRGPQSDGDGNVPQGSDSARHYDGAASLTAGEQAQLERLVAERVAQEHAKTEEANTRWQRTQADFANYKRRNEQERDQQGRFATLVLVSELLPVLDDLDRALTTMPEAVHGLPWTEGLRLVDRNLRGTLEKQGLKNIEAVGTKFDPMLHEAIIHEESPEHEDDEVIAELRRGYMLHDRVVRPTLVKVAKHVDLAE